MSNFDSDFFNSTTILELKQVLEKVAKEQYNTKNIKTTSNVDNTFFHSKKPFDLTNEELIQKGQDYIDFTYESPTIYHVVANLTKDLTDNGFTYISEKFYDEWKNLQKGGKYFTKRGDCSLLAFTLGGQWDPKTGCGAIGSHIDALHVKLKPASIKNKFEGYELLGVANYGGTLNELWLNRDLGLGGRVIIKDSSKKFKTVLIDSTPDCIAFIPSLAPHYGEPSKFPYDTESQTVPIIGYFNDESREEAPPTKEEKASPLFGKHSINLLRYIAKMADVKVSELYQLDLELYDIQKGTFGGLKKDFLMSPRQDDRLCSYPALQSLINFSKITDLESSKDLNIVVLYDKEEVGSLDRQGARSGLFDNSVARILSSYASDDIDSELLFRTTLSNSFFLSADVIHLHNPNFDSVYLENHKPKPNVGVTISLDPNGHMATDAIGVSIVEEIARINGDKLQYFQIKNNSRSGGTIGPSIACTNASGVRVIDLGIAELSMHAIREVTGAKDVGLGIRFFTNFFRTYKQVLETFGDL
ncbi:hypothetical protein ACO0SA_002188 [Hanseniaspora valbyensis]